MSEMQALAMRPVRARSGVRRLRENRVAVGAAVGIAVLALLALFGPWLSPYTYDALDWRHLAAAPGVTDSHWLGTDLQGLKRAQQHPAGTYRA